MHLHYDLHRFLHSLLVHLTYRIKYHLLYKRVYIYTNNIYKINAQESLVNSYDSEHKNYIDTNIYDIQKAATNKKSTLAWETINAISGRKKSNKSKLKASNDNERIKLWHKHFKDLLGKNIQSIIHSKNV